MVFAKPKYDPNLTQVTLQARLAISPTLSLSKPDATLDITLGLRISNTAYSGEPVTILTHRSAFEVFGDDGIDMFARGAFGAIQALDNDNQPMDKRISLGFFRVNEVVNSDSPDLRERGYQFLTIPGDGSEVTVTHRLSWERIFKYEENLSWNDLTPGERFSISVNERYIGTSWWCLGDLEGVLRDKKFHSWTTDEFGEQRPDDNFLRKGNWVLGRNPKELYWKVDKDSNEEAVFEIVD